MGERQQQQNGYHTATTNGANGHQAPSHQDSYHEHPPHQQYMNGNATNISSTNGINHKIEFEYNPNHKQKNVQSDMNDSNELCCPCCDSVHNMDDNISTHLSEIAKLYNLKNSTEWKKFLLLPLHNKQPQQQCNDANEEEKEEEEIKENVRGLFNGFS